jgi:hypothetical protein
VSCIQEKWLLIPQTIHRDEALRIAVAPSGLYRLSVTISSKTITSEKQTYFLFWDGTFDNVKFDDARELTRPQDYPRDEHIPLHVAASEAYGATRGTIVSEMAERGEDPKHHINVLTWYATYMAVTFKAPIYGQMRLSPKREPVDMASFHFEMEGDDRIIAKETWGNKVWEHITIKRADLDRAIQGLQDTVREFNEQHRN